MALAPVRREFRLTLSQVDRGRDLAETVIVGQHPSETGEHLILRLFAYCLFSEERLEFGPGLSTPDAADLWTHDLTGRLVSWIECGAAQADKLRKIILHHAGVAVHVLLCDERRREELLAELALLKGASGLTVWFVPRALVAELARSEERRQRWSVTVVGDHLYIEADGHTVDGEAIRCWP